MDEPAFLPFAVHWLSSPLLGATDSICFNEDQTAIAELSTSMKCHSLFRSSCPIPPNASCWLVDNGASCNWHVMESLGSQDVESTSDLVQRYLQDTELTETGVEERGYLAQICSECILLFRVILKTLGKDNDSGTKERKMMEVSLTRSYGRMKIWSEENGAADGVLDATLAASPDLQRDTRRYIVSISETLTESKSTSSSSARNILASNY